MVKKNSLYEDVKSIGVTGGTCGFSSRDREEILSKYTQDDVNATYQRITDEIELLMSMKNTLDELV